MNHNLESRIDIRFQSWIDSLRSGDMRTLARAISTVENRAPGMVRSAEGVVPAQRAARSHRPDRRAGSREEHAGRPTGAALRKQNHTVGIIAVDPTSPYTGGAILGDRIRMQEHFADPGIYIRSMATRGSLGGLARTTADVTTVLDASGRDVILIETVGVGQDEVDIVRLADITVVILVPGMGDDVQTIKAGIMEIADIFVINKSDREGAERVEREIRALQSLGAAPRWMDAADREDRCQRRNRSRRSGRGDRRLRRVSAERESGAEKERRELAGAPGRNAARRNARKSARAVRRRKPVARLAAEVAEHKRDPYTLVEEIAAKAENT